MYERIKRGWDFLLAIIGMIVSIPIGVVVAISIKMTSKGPILYKQERLGKQGKVITIYKFRTMMEEAESKIKELPKEKQMEYEDNYRMEQDPRVTKVGRFLRQSNLDEIPQLWNVIKGELSLIGPRPVLKEEIKKYGEKQEILLGVTPGLSGYWQIHRNQCKNYEQRVEMELFYIEHRNLLLDTKLFFQTIFYCIKKFIKLLIPKRESQI